jgi:hypothetical protein
MSFLCRALLSVLLMRNRLAEQHRAFSDWAGENFLDERHGTRLCAHAPNPTMQRPSVANTATVNSASIMAPSTESRLPFEGLICPK